MGLVVIVEDVFARECEYCSVCRSDIPRPVYLYNQIVINIFLGNVLA